MSISLEPAKENMDLIDIKRPYSIPSFDIKNSSTKVLLLHLRNLADHIKERRQKNRSFYDTFIKLKPQYTSNIYSMMQILKNLRAEINQIVTVDLTCLQNRNDYLKMKIPVYEVTLVSSRVYAEKRRNKKLMRESQYSRVYYVPIISQEFKKKYISARDKYAFAEEKLSEIRKTIDKCQKEMIQNARSITETMKKIDIKTEHYENIKEELLRSKKVFQNLHEQFAYWRKFDSHQSVLTLRAVDSFIKLVLKNTGPNISNAYLFDIDYYYMKNFQKICYEYGKAEIQGEILWDQKSVNYTCTNCKTDQKGSSTADRVYYLGLLCTECYRLNHGFHVY